MELEQEPMTGRKAYQKNTSARTRSGERLKLPASAAGTFSALGFLALAVSLLVFPGQVGDSVGGSILYCLTVLTPSLFPFMALTSFAVNSGAGDALGKPLGFLAKYVFRLPKACTVPILMSFLGGYPAGARGASLLLEQGKINREQAGRMTLFCVNPGVAFVVTFLGGAVLQSFRLGWLLFLAVTLGGIVLGVAAGLAVPFPIEPERRESAPGGGALMRSVSDASSSVLKMCACIVLFSGFTAILHGSGAYQALVGLLSSTGLLGQTESAAVLSFLIEVTGGVGDAAKFQVAPAFYAFGLAFGGLCVHLQVFSFFPRFPSPKWKFFLFRFLHGFLAAGIFLLFCRLFPGAAEETLATAGNTGFAFGGLSGTLAGGLSLLLMCAAFLLITMKGGEKEDCATDRDVIK